MKPSTTQMGECRMIEIECPFCLEPSRMDAAAFVAETCAVRCDGCGIEVEISDARPAQLIALAA